MSNQSRIFLLGPTASGKTELTKFCYDNFPIDIISVDSAQVYKGFDIGSAKPTQDELSKYPHQLVNIIDPYLAYSAYDFNNDVERLCDESKKIGRIPFLSGGTMMYFNSLEFPLDDIPATNLEIRTRVAADLEKYGLSYLYQKLNEFDPDSARRILPSDTQRILRALEVFYESGKPLSSFYSTKKNIIKPPPLLKIALFPHDREKLHSLIESRVDKMLSNGLVEEVEGILNSHPSLDESYSSLRAVGYKQTYYYLKGKLAKEDLRDRIVFATRQLAKRQITWMRKMQNLRLFDPFQENLQTQVKESINTFLDKY